ncbi:sensory box GGDEF domain-containing protein [Pseudomonas aeruginosa]|nr:sensory box GGDEF domain-containing protein [Pseudomonas aeruginosa]
MLKRACRQMREWQQRGVELEFVAVNVSSRLFNRGGLEERIANALEESGLEPRYLELEVTESAVMEDFEQSLNLLCRLRILGVNLAIDDFGTGYSSLMRLKRLPVHKLKIDQGFVAGLPGAVDDAAIARAIVALAQSMGLRVVAEGIEHQDQALFLREHGLRLRPRLLVRTAATGGSAALRPAARGAAGRLSLAAEAGPLRRLITTLPIKILKQYF